MGARGGLAGTRGRDVLLAGLIAGWTLLLRVPFLGGPNFSPDAAEYAGMARRFAEGKGLTTAIKWHFLDTGPVVRPAAVERPPLYPLFGGVVLRAFPRADALRALQAANALLSALTASLAFLAYRSVAAPEAALAAAFLLPLLPPVAQTSIAALSEPLFLLLWMAALLALPRAVRPGGAAVYGLLAALAALTRPHGALLLLPLLRRKRLGSTSGRMAAAAALGVFLLLLAPWLALTARAGRQGMRPGTAVNFAVAHIRQASWHGYGKAIPSPGRFVLDHPRLVARGIARKARENTRALVLALGPLLLLLPLPLLAGRGEPGKRSAGPEPAPAADWLLLAAANFAAASASWVAAGSTRYMLPSALLLLPLVVARGLDGGPRRALARLGWVLLVAAAVAYFGSQAHGHLGWCRRGWEPGAWQRYRTGAGWVGQAQGDDASVVATNNPWMVHYLTGRPAVACPFFPPGTDAASFARQFGVRWFLLFTNETDRRLLHCRNHPGLRLPRASGRERVYLFTLR